MSSLFGRRRPVGVRRSRNEWWHGWIGCLLSLLTISCWLAPSGARAEDAKARARTLFGEGVAAFDRSDFEVALESFTQAYRLAPHPTVRVNMANCYEQLGRYSEAVFNYQRFLEESGSNVSPEQRADVESAILRLKQKFGEIIIETRPSEATVTVDGSTPQRGLDGRIQLRTGNHVVRASLAGYEDIERIVEIVGGSEQRVRLDLSPETQAAPLPVEPVEARGEEAWRPVSQSNASGADAARNLRPAMWLTLGAAALCGIGAGITGGLALKSEHDFNDAVAISNAPGASGAMRAQARADGLNASDRADAMALATDVLWISAALGATTSFVLWVVDRKRASSDSSMAFMPSVSAHGDAQLLVRGAF